MAASPKYKVYSHEREYMGSVKYAEDAARLVSGMQDGATIRIGHTWIVWTEGTDGEAGASYDEVRELVHRREAENVNHPQL